MASPRKSSSTGDPLLRRPASPSSTPHPILGILVAAARKLLFIDAQKIAMFYLFLVTILSFFDQFFQVDSTFYLVQKHSVFNQYGVKLGWFWTLVIVGPFIWLTSKEHYRRDRDMPFIDVCRLGVGTFFWWIVVQLFHKITAATSVCDKGMRLTRHQCSEKQGVWTPGYDISGHCFLMVYSILIMTEEAKAFKNYKQVTDSVHESDGDQEKHISRTKWIHYLFVLMMVLHIIWFKQIIISVLYYHIHVEKILATLVAIFCWFVSYRIAYPAGLLHPPINRKNVKSK